MKIKKRKKVIVKKGMNKTQADNMMHEFYRIKEQKKMLEKRELELRDKLAEYMEKSFKKDSKGHYLYSGLNEKGEKIHLQRQARRKIALDKSKAIKFLRDNGLDHLVITTEIISPEVTDDQVLELVESYAPSFIDEVETVDEDALAHAVTNEELTMEEFESICDIQTNYVMTFVDDKKLIREEGD